MVGNGIMGQRHLERLQARGLTFNAILDNEAEVLQFWKSQGCRMSRGLAVIASPAITHFQYAKLFLEHGWSVFVEKPLTTSALQAKELVDLAYARNLPLFTGHSERYHPLLANFPRQLKESFASGKLTHIETHRENIFSGRARDVNVTFDILVHDLDLIFYAVGLPMARSVKVCSAEACFDSVSAELLFANGLSAKLYANRKASEPVRTVSLCGAETILKVDLIPAPSPGKDALEKEYDALFDTLKCPERNAATLECAVLAVQTADRISRNF